jgi:hypothetical protein
MSDLIRSVDLWVSIIGGIVAGVATAILISLVAYLWNRRKHRVLKDLTIIMGKAIDHRNAGRTNSFADGMEWVRQAKEIERHAVARANKLSSTAGSLVEWLDRVDPWPVGSEVDMYVSILSKVIERIRELLERNS